MKTKCLTLISLKSHLFRLFGLMWVMVLMGSISKVTGQACPLACNDNIQVSVDANCKSEITPDMLLEAPGVNCNYQVVIYDENNQPLPDDTVRYQHVGKTLRARVTLGANSCWSYITVEDKIAPRVDCASPDFVMCNQPSYTVSPDVVTDNCGNVKTVVLSDELIDLPCDSAYAAVREICRYYVDDFGNHSDTCCHKVYFYRPSLADIQLPTDVKYNCSSFQSADPRITGVPTWNGLPLYPDRGVCEINIEYSDDTLNVCPGTYKIIREWLIYDWCLPSNNGNPKIGYQAIKVADEDGPIVYCPTTDVAPDTVATDAWTCTGSTILPEPHILSPGQVITDSTAVYIISECSDVSYSVRHLPARSPQDCTPERGNGTQDHVRYDSRLKRWFASDLPAGCNWFYYTFTDECGNTSECTFDIYVVDKTPPNAICDHHTVASLGIDGRTKVFAASLDDESWDNCDIDTMLVRRMDFGSPCGLNQRNFTDYVEFCCNDLGHTRMVEFMVVDKAGNKNTCMVEVTVQDKIPPVVTCPPNVTVSCQFDLTDLSVFGGLVNAQFNQTPNPIVINDPYVQFDGPAFDGEYYDNCTALIDTFSSRNIECGEGQVLRTFVVRDQGGLEVRCTQRITIRDFDQFRMTSGNWPRNYFDDTDCTTGPVTDPDVTGRPTIPNRGCGDIYVGYEDQTFYKEPDACLKVLRKWQVIDWCHYNPNNPQAGGYWEYTQLIKINNSVAPTFTSTCTNKTYELYGADCMESIHLTASAQDDCTDEKDLIWKWSLDLNSDGVPDNFGTGNDFYRNLGPGTYQIWWTVSDVCGNENHCHYRFDVIDRKDPTPYCRDQIVTVLMEQVLSVDVWAKDLDLGSEDNCTNKEDLQFFFLVNGRYVTSRTFDCSHVGINVVRMYVRDEAGNEDYCEVKVEIQDPNGYCGTGSFVQVSGDLETMMGERVSYADVTLTNMGNNAVKMVKSDNNGAFAFDNVMKYGSYDITVEKNDDILNGVTTRDLVILQRHLLGVEEMTSPYQYIAADANNNEELSAADIASIRRVILGRTLEFGSGQKSWRFVNAATIFTDPQYPWPYEETMKYYDINGDQMDSDFRAVKIGDLDGDVVGLQGGTSTRSHEEVALKVRDREVSAGEVIEVPVYVESGQQINALQMMLEVTGNGQIVGVENGQMHLCDDCYALKGNKMTMSWFAINPEQFNAEDAIFTVRIEMGSDDQLSNVLRIGSEMTPARLYSDLVSDAYTVRLGFDEESQVGEGYALHQNVPNPFTSNTRIGFEVPNSQNVELTIFDVTGRVVKFLEGHFDKGYHEFIITGEDLNVEGVLYYQLNAGTYSSTRKMLLVR